MATKNYMINDKWLDLDKQNIVELQSVDGVLDSLKVNGSEIETPSGKITITENGTDIDIAQYATADVNVEGGGGSSDFSTANVTIISSASGEGRFTESRVFTAFVSEDAILTQGQAMPSDESTFEVILYKEGATPMIIVNDRLQTLPTVTGDITYDLDNDQFLVTGDGTITIELT